MRSRRKRGQGTRRRREEGRLGEKEEAKEEEEYCRRNMEREVF